MVEITKHPNPKTGYHDIVFVESGWNTFQSPVCDLSVLDFTNNVHRQDGIFPPDRNTIYDILLK